ncbi:MAG: PEP-CTERM sorting domain-containing protein [Planctomycetota bacterium]|nr:MAG: PEP-CTERM sorting domain-containing protein [Planctomycetota bacterium]
MWKGALGGTILALSVLASPSRGDTTFAFSNNGISNQPAASLTSGDFTLNLAAGGPAGSYLYESNGNPELGVGPGGSNLSIEIIGGVAEYVEFSFDEPGILRGIDFDGVKDEALEFFLLESAGVRINFFDSAANTTVAGAVDNAVNQGVVTGDVFYLLETFQFDDTAMNLAIPFSAGQTFRLTYSHIGDLGAPYSPTEPQNGARIQTITVDVPEPSSFLLAAAGLAVLGFAHRRRRRV